jgi:hypothetical protein
VTASTKPLNVTHGEEQATGDEVEISITFTSDRSSRGSALSSYLESLWPAAILYLWLDPSCRPAYTIAGDLQAWIRSSDLAPDWLRIGTDIVADPATPTFNMTFSLTGAAIPNAGTPGQAIARQTTSAGPSVWELPSAVSSLGFSGSIAPDRYQRLLRTVSRVLQTDAFVEQGRAHLVRSLLCFKQSGQPFATASEPLPAQPIGRVRFHGKAISRRISLCLARQISLPTTKPDQRKWENQE